MLKELLCIAAVLLTMASSAAVGESTEPPPTFDPPKQHYLALGDSLAFGFRFDIFDQHFPVEPPDLFHGYVDDFSAMLERIRPDIQTTNFGCVGETTDTFINGGCLYTAQGFRLHEGYTGSQLSAAIAFLDAHRGKVSPITFNLGTNDLNALTELCGSDFACYEFQAPMFLNRIAANIDRILAALRRAAPDAEIITFTNYSVAFLIDPRFLELTDAFNAVVESTAAIHRVRVADVFAAFNEMPQPGTICNLTAFCTSGDSHPTDAGYRAIAEELWKASDYDKLGD